MDNISLLLILGLNKGLPNKCLPLDFMGYYALAGREQENRLRTTIRNYMIADINRRRDYVKTLTMGTGQTDKALSQLPHILPDYMLVFAVPVLAHDPHLTKWDDVQELTKAKQCLWFILEPLVVKSDYFSYGFYKSLIEKMKNHKNAVRPEDDSINYVSRQNRRRYFNVYISQNKTKSRYKFLHCFNGIMF